MPSNRSAVFLIQLVQDVHVLRPLVYMATRDFAFDTLLLVSTKFSARDAFGIWRNELRQICAETGARVEYFEDDWDAHHHLTGQGLLFAASESHLPNHTTTHNLFRHAPPSYLRVTLQHGFECVGFRHNADHVRAHGRTASFAADLLCTWFGDERLSSMAPSQRAKVLVTGPTSVLQMPASGVEHIPGSPGLVCENLHSVRFKQGSGFKTEFVGAFAEFARLMALNGKQVALRPHPGGQYMLKNKIALPLNVRVENAPMYRLDLRQFSYGISAPSSVLMDFLLAGIPTAVWRDRRGKMDASGYEGLTILSSPRDWVEFAQAAERDPEQFLELQQGFLDSQQMPLDPRDVFSRYARLFQSAARAQIRAPGSVAERDRLLFVANGNVPTLQLSFEKPLAPLVARGEIATRLLTEAELREKAAAMVGQERFDEWIGGYLDDYNPAAIVFCRYSGPSYRFILDWARRRRVPVIYHIDDDLLSVPAEIGDRKAAFHNDRERLAAVTELMTSADLVYASTPKLGNRLLDRFPRLPLTVGEIYCASTVLREPRRGPVQKVGYMASRDHAHNFEMILPAVERLLDRNPQLEFEFFGSIPVPPGLRRFGERVRSVGPIGNYEDFLDAFAERGWDIGLCPLAPIEFNLMKANTKWVEYTAAGAAVVASRGTVYDQSCAGGCGILADTSEEWFSALDRLVKDDEERLAMVRRAQAKLQREFNLTRLREQVLEIVSKAREARGCDGRRTSKEEASVCQI